MKSNAFLKETRITHVGNQTWVTRVTRDVGRYIFAQQTFIYKQNSSSVDGQVSQSVKNTIFQLSRYFTENKTPEQYWNNTETNLNIQAKAFHWSNMRSLSTDFSYDEKLVKCWRRLRARRLTDDTYWAVARDRRVRWSGARTELGKQLADSPTGRPSLQ